MKNNWRGAIYLVFGVVIWFILFCFFSKVYALCSDEYLLADELIKTIGEYSPGVQVKSYSGLVDYIKINRQNLSGFTLFEHFSWVEPDLDTEDYVAAGIDDWAGTYNIFLNDLAEMRSHFIYDA